jgi:hypothetical protein
MTAQAAGVNSDAAAKPSWDAPVAMIGGLPIAVIDRARSAELMIDVCAQAPWHRPAPAYLHLGERSGALAVRPATAGPRAFSRSGSDPRGRHATGSCLTSLPQDTAAGTGRDHRPLPRRCSIGATHRRAHVPARRDECRRASERFTRASLSSGTTADICDGRETKSASSIPSTALDRTFCGLVSARRPNNRSPSVIATGCEAWD